MEKSKIFTAFYHLSELRNREDLITAVITNLDYTMHVLTRFYFVALEYNKYIVMGTPVWCS